MPRPAPAPAPALAAATLAGVALALATLAGPAPDAHAATAESVGINTHQPDWQRLDACDDLQVRFIRVDFNWFQVAPAPGAPDWGLAPFDAVVAGAAARGLEVFATLAYGPAWASMGDGDGLPNNDVPDLAAWDTFVRAAVGRYGADVKHWGLWNEPNLGGFFEGSALDYADLARAGARAVHETCTDCLVLGPELAAIGDYDAFLETVLAALPPPGDVESFDLLTQHSYHDFSAAGGTDTFVANLDVTSGLFGRRSFREVVVGAGAGWGDVEVWITETGYSAPVDDPARLATQALYYEAVLAEQLARAWWTVTMFYEITDDPFRADGVREGVTWPIDGGASTDFHDWFTFKPVYGGLRNRILTTPPLQAGDETVPALGSWLSFFEHPRSLAGGAPVTLRARFRNVGTATWTAGPGGVRLAPGDDAPAFGAPPMLLAADVSPGGDADFTLALVAPGTAVLSSFLLTFRLETAGTGGAPFGDLYQAWIGVTPGGDPDPTDGGATDGSSDAGGAGGGGPCGCAISGPRGDDVGVPWALAAAIAWIVGLRRLRLG